MTQINVKPTDYLPISVKRQQQIIDAINEKLSENPLRGFCLMGAPGTGKTYLMKAIQGACNRVQLVYPKSHQHVSHIYTLAEWQENNRLRVLNKATDKRLDFISTKTIREYAEHNDFGLSGHNLEEYRHLRHFYNPTPLEPSAEKAPLHTLHLFIDEFDCQPSVTEFSSSNLQTFVNGCYAHAPRINRTGQEREFVQLVVAMNKSWEEFEEAYGVHVARRIAEMCVRIDFDKSRIDGPIPERTDLQKECDDELELLIQEDD